MCSHTPVLSYEKIKKREKMYVKIFVEDTSLRLGQQLCKGDRYLDDSAGKE